MEEPQPEMRKPEIRIGDRERREVDSWLQEAHGDGRLTLAEYEERSATCWAARTQGELAELTRDLPPPQASVVATAPERPATAAPRQESWLRRGGIAIAVIAVATGVVWGGSQAVGADDGFTLFGSRDVPVAAGDGEVQVGVVFGSVDVVVPDDARVTTSGGLVFGSVECGAACNGTGTQEVVVDTGGAFGSVDILTASEQAAGVDLDDDDDDDDDD